MASFDADLVIAGGGCAGLSALWHAQELAPGRRIVIVDAQAEPGDDRTWAFWGRDDAAFVHLADRHWDQVAVRFPGWESTQRLIGRSYHRVRRHDYDTALWERAHASDDVEVVVGRVTDLSDEADGARVTTTAGTVRAPTVFQSVRLSPEALAAPVRHRLRQHFGGWEVRTERAVFDPAVATFMDFDTPQLGGATFFYVLPEAEDRALVEHTLFSPDPQPPTYYDDHIAAHLARLGAGEVSVERREYGAIPMEDRRIDQRWGRHIFNIGGVGGRTKPSTGYTFQRIHDQVAHLVAGWAAGRITPLPEPHWRYRLADDTLLHVLHRRPDLACTAFERLFRTLGIDEVLDFLDERSRLVDDLAMMARMPRGPFARAGAAEVAALLGR